METQATKKVLLVYYSQTGQLHTLAQHFAAPLQAQKGIEVEMLALQPVVPYAFPWRFWRFFNTFPETVHLQPAPIVPPQTAHAQYDLVVLAYTVWFLSPSQPMTAFLQSPQAAALLRDTPVITLIGCRNMWLMAQEQMKRLLAGHGARLVGNVVKIDACSSAASFVTTPAWMLTGQRQFFRTLPAAGIADADLADAARFGARTREGLLSGAVDETLLRGMGAVRVNEKLIFSEKVARRSFYLWGKLLLAAGRVAPWLRRALLAFYIVFLVLMIVTVVPISALVKTALAPLVRNSIARQKQYFSQPSGE